MGFSLTLAMLLLAAPLDPTDLFEVELEGKTVAVLNRDDVTLPFSGIPLVDVNQLESVVDELDKLSYREPINATVSDSGRIVPEQKGRRLDRREFLSQVYHYYYGAGSKGLHIPFQVIHPKVDRALLKQVQKKTIGRYITYFNSGNKNRSHNIMLASKAIHNYVLLPGEIFSFNKVVGKRTPAKGYLQAPVIVRGELSEGIGGGICQVSSTLFNAVDKAGLHILQRYSHSRHVAYVPPGRDATVSWNGPDFVFQNKYAYPILIKARSANGQMYVSIHSFPELEYDPRDVPSVQEHLPEEEPINPSLTDQPAP
ncbi:VanW family protein [Brevibacillus panacihumi]|uniref:VanW family protein n=1 Tax=Brevibacillus panacihumi TaxID=497735 RepID=UPI003D1B2F90